MDRNATCLRKGTKLNIRKKILTRFTNPVYQSLVYYAAVTLDSLTKACTDLLSAKINNTQLNVTRKETSNESSVNVHPKFHRVRTVTVGNGRMVCNCSYSPDNGLPCIHMLHVSFLADTYEGA